MGLYRTVIVLISSVIGLSTAMADVPKTVHFSGQLDTANGSFTGTADIHFRLYHTATGGNDFWDELRSVDVVNGRYHVMLGTVSALDTDDLAGGATFLGISVAADSEFPERIVLSSVPYARLAENAEQLGGRPAQSYMTLGGNLIQWEDNNTSAWVAQGSSGADATITDTKTDCDLDSACTIGDYSVEGESATTFVNQAWVIYDTQGFIPVDTTRTYYGRAWAKATTIDASFYAGYVAYDAQKTLLSGNGGSNGYFIANNEEPGMAGAWYEGFITGEGTEFDTFPVGTRFIKPLIIANYNHKEATTYVDAFYIGEVTPLPDDSVTSAHILDGTIVAADTDNDSVQQRIDGTCPAGSSIRAIANDGSVTCQTDTGTTYSAQANGGLILTDTAFGLMNADCQAGYVLKRNDTNTGWECTFDEDTTYDGSYFASSAQACSAGSGVIGISDSGEIQCELMVHVEQDPSVELLHPNLVPRWTGAVLTDGTLYDDGSGRLGIGTHAPLASLDVVSTDTAIRASVAAGHGTATALHAKATALSEQHYTLDLGTEYMLGKPDVFQPYFPDGRVESILSTSILTNSMGLKAGPIQTVYIRVHQNSFRTIKNVHIRMQHTTEDEFSGNNTCNFTENGGWTPVFGPSDVNLSGSSAGTYLALPLTQPFTWDGESNIRIDFTKDQTTSDWAYEGGMSIYDTTQSTMCFQLNTNNILPWPFSGTGSVRKSVPGLRFNMPAGTATAGVFEGNVSINGNIDCTNCIDAEDIGANAVGSSEIADGGVGSSEIATDAVGIDEIADNSVNAGELVGNAVRTEHIYPNTIKNEDVATNAAIEGSKINPNFGSQAIKGGYLTLNGSNASMVLDGSGSTLPDLDSDSHTEKGAYVSSGDGTRRSIRFRSGGNNGDAGTGGIRFGRYNNDDFYLHRTYSNLYLDFFDYTASPNTQTTLMKVTDGGDVTISGNLTVSGDVTVDGAFTDNGTSVYRVINAYCANYNGLSYSQSCITRVCGTYKESFSVTWKLHFYTCSGGCSATSAKSCTDSDDFSLVGYLMPQ